MTPVNDTQWRPLGNVDPRSLSEARLQAHYALQWLARATRGYVAAKPDDSHTNLGWDDTLDGFLTHALPNGTRLGLSISALTLVLIDGKDGRRMHSLSLPGRSDGEARAWLGERMLAFHLDPMALDAPPQWEMPAHAIADGAAYAGESLVAARKELATWFANADRALGRIRAAYAAKQFTVSPVRCWPHHFDIATLISLEGGDPDHARSVNAGLSPGDGSYDEPYFYVSPWPYPDAARLPSLPSIGHWHMEGFLAAVAPASRIITAAIPQQAAEEFVRAAVAGSMAALA
jgi:hypothetical protein